MRRTSSSSRDVISQLLAKYCADSITAYDLRLVLLFLPRYSYCTIEFSRERPGIAVRRSTHRTLTFLREEFMSVAMTKGQTSAADHRSSRLQEMSPTEEEFGAEERNVSPT